MAFSLYVGSNSDVVVDSEMVLPSVYNSRHRGVGHYLAGSLENGGENEGHECGSTSTYVGPKVEKKCESFSRNKICFLYR